MVIIYETQNFILESHEKPEIDRLEGGHAKISAKRRISDRTKLKPNEAIEVMRLTILAGKAITSAMKKQGITIGRINYQENGNWKPEFHIHLYSRAINATVQKYGEPIKPGHKKKYKPYSKHDIYLIQKEIKRLLKTKYFKMN